MPRSTLIGWILAALIAVGGAATVVWASQERSGVQEQVAPAEAELEERRKELERVRKSLEASEEEADDLAASLDSCVEAIDSAVQEIFSFARDLAGSSFGAIPSLQDEIQDMIDRAETELECEVGATDTV